jgi:hypothetical protein
MDNWFKRRRGCHSKEAIEATKIIFSKMTADGPIDTITNEPLWILWIFENEMGKKIRIVKKSDILLLQFG